MKWYKYKIQKKQVSTDAGVTWVDVTPYETRRGQKLGEFDTYNDCMNAIQDWFCSDDWYVNYIPDDNTKMIVSYRQNGNTYYDGFEFTGATDNSISKEEINAFPHNYIKNKKNVTISEGVEIINERAFEEYDATGTIEFPSTLRTIGEYAFAMSEINFYDIPDAVTSIGKGAFSGVWTYGHAIDYIKWPSGTPVIPEEAFADTGIGKMIWPETLNSIEKEAFTGGSQIGEVYAYGKVPPRLGSHVWHVPGSNVVSTTIKTAYTPYYSIEDYRGVIPAQTILPIEEDTKYYHSYNANFWHEVSSSQYSLGLDNPEEYRIFLGACPHDYLAIQNGIYFYGYSEITFKVRKYSGSSQLEVSNLNDSESVYYSLTKNNEWVDVTFNNLIPTEAYRVYFKIGAGVIGLNGQPGLVAILKNKEKVKLMYSDGSEYKFPNDNDYILTTYYTKPLDYDYSLMTSAEIGNITIIDNNAFQNCTALTSVTLSSMVNDIRNAAFYNCTSLNSIISFATVPPLVGYLSFYGVPEDCTVYVHTESVNAYKTASGWSNFNIEPIPTPNYKYYGDYGRAGKLKLACNSVDEDYISQSLIFTDDDSIKTMLETAVIGDCVDSISDKLFSGCTSLSSVTLSNNIRNITYYAFGNCSGLTSVIIPNSVVNISPCAFINCSGLTSMNIPDNVKEIGYSAFAGCMHLTNLTIGSGVEYIGEGAFTDDVPGWVTYKADWSHRYNNIVYAGKVACKAASLNMPSVIFRDDTTSIMESAFRSCSGFTSVFIPGTVNDIGTYAFQNCKDLTNVELGNGIKKIGYYSFENCSGLTSINIPSSVREFGVDVFRGCTNLSSVKIYSTVPPKIEYNTFPSNTYIYVPYSSINLYKSVWTNYKDMIRGFNTSYIANYSDGRAYYTENNYYYISAEITKPSGYDYTETVEAYIGNLVSKIYDSALYEFTNLRIVSIGSGIKQIGSNAFRYCESLEKITIDAKNPPTLGENAFADTNSCPIYVNRESVDLYKEAWSEYAERIYPKKFEGKISLKYEPQYGTNTTYITLCDDSNKITSAETNPSGFDKVYFTEAIVGECVNLIDGAFNSFSGLRSVELPNTIFNIYNSAFKSCKNLTNIDLPSSLNTIGDGAFCYCSGLTNVTLPERLQWIGDTAFYSCTNLTNINIPNSVIHIGSSAFRYCTGLTSIDIPSGVTSIGDRAFQDCYSLRDLSIGGGSLGKYLVSGCTSLTGLTLGNGFTSIGDNAFQNLYTIVSVTIPNSVTSIGKSAFLGCSGLTSINIPNSVTSIGDNAFADCKGFTSINTPNSIINIGDRAFYNCISATSATVESGSIGDETFANCSGLTSLNIGSGVTSIGTSAFTNCYKLTSIDIPDSVTNIGNSAFTNCSGITSVTVGSGSTVIGSLAFFKCNKIKTCTIESGILTNQVFAGCSGLTSVTLGNGVTNIGYSSFYECSGLTSVTIGNGVTFIGYEAFDRCRSLSSVIIHAITPPTIEEYAFDRNASGRKIYVPVESVEAYKQAWTGYASSILPIPTNN